MIKHRLLWDIQQRRLTFDEWKYINPLSPVYVQGYEDRRYINQFFKVVDIEDREFICTLYDRAGGELHLSFSPLDRVMLLEKEEATSLKLLVDSVANITQKEFDNQLESINKKYEERLKRISLREHLHGIDYLRSASSFTFTGSIPTSWTASINASDQVPYPRVTGRRNISGTESETHTSEDNTS